MARALRCQKSVLTRALINQACIFERVRRLKSKDPSAFIDTPESRKMKADQATRERKERELKERERARFEEEQRTYLFSMDSMHPRPIRA